MLQLLFTDDLLQSSNIDIPYVIISSVICACGLIENMTGVFVIVILKEYQKSVTHW